MHSVQPCLIVFDGEDSWAEICSSQLVLIKKVLILNGVGERLREERDRLGLNQTDFGIAAGVSRGTQKAYELESSSPDVRYLAALQGMSVDVHFVLTGSRHSIDAASLNEEESLVLEQFRSLPEHDRASVKRLTGALVDTVRVKS
jgi:transcriptional regulator with XRE-family HTH domain